ncbi:MAG: glycine--tRNA ligase subunit beta [Desulfomonile sp.]|nr:glycine--tRNA ligase subunit beta [Desulfomonile sp.]
MKGELLIEVGSEEIPAGYVMPAVEALAGLLEKALDDARIGHGFVTVAATPRRLIVSVADVADAQEPREVEKTGPPVASAFDAEGKPTKAAVGFARSQGVDIADLIIIATPRGEQVGIRKREEGRPTLDVLAELLPGLIERTPFPKSMRWMDLDVRFARPLHWIVALYDGRVIPFTYGNINSGDTSRGHRFTAPEEFRISSLGDLRTVLAAQGIEIDPQARRARIAEEIEALAQGVGLSVFSDDELMDEITFLVESPYPVMGEFPVEFLDLPASILVTCMKKHQRYFSLQNGDGRITNRFIAVNNTPVRDEAVSVRGHQRVLKARLEDARFYFREDRKHPLISRLDALKGVVFHSRLGTSYEKVQRFTHLAKKLAERYAPAKLAEVERAALLAKCDLVTGIVYEFPELQGIIGSYYARMDGEPDEVANAVMEHYLPTHAGDSLPEGTIGALVSIADRIDTIVGCFSVGLIPTGAADPYALRRHALAVIQILIDLDKPLDLDGVVRESLGLLNDKRTRPWDEVERDVMDFIRTRFVNFHTSRQFSLDVVEAVVRARFDDVVDARRRVKALQRWKQREDFERIITGFKRVVNILKNTSPGIMEPDLLTEEAEIKLYESFKDVRARVAPLIHSGEYFQALEIVAELRAPIDALFDTVMVMVEDDQIRENRLGLLKRIADFFAQIADFSFIGSTAESR